MSEEIDLDLIEIARRLEVELRRQGPRLVDNDEISALATSMVNLVGALKDPFIKRLAQSTLEVSPYAFLRLASQFTQLDLYCLRLCSVAGIPLVPTPSA